MKKFTFCLILFLSTLNSKSQVNTYCPFLNHTDWYRVSNGLFGNSYNWYHSQNDTIINGITYKIIIRIPGSGAPNLVREDVAQKKVYLRNQTNNTDELLYDFSIGVGQSYLCRPYGSTSATPFTVKKIDTVNTLIGPRRRFQLEASNTYTVEVIEGIGSEEDPFLFTSWGGEPVMHVVCSYENNVQVYMYNDGYNVYTCPTYPAITGVKESSLKNTSVKVLYQYNEVSLQFENENNKTVKLTLIDALGRQVMTRSGNSNIFKIQCDSYSKGIYYYLIELDNKSVSTGKIIINY